MLLVANCWRVKNLFVTQNWVSSLLIINAVERFFVARFLSMSYGDEVVAGDLHDPNTISCSNANGVFPDHLQNEEGQFNLC